MAKLKLVLSERIVSEWTKYYKMIRQGLLFIRGWMWLHRRSLAAVVWFGVMWSWSLFTNSIELSGTKTQGRFIVAIVAAINITIASAIVILFFRILDHASQKMKPIRFMIFGLSLTALMDFLVAWLVALVWIGPQGSIDSVITLSSPALLIMNTPFSFAARLLGFYGLGAFGWLVFYVLSKKSYKIFGLLVALLSVFAVLGWLLYLPTEGKQIKVVIVSETLKQRVAQIDSADTDLVVFPEYGLDAITNKNYEQRIEKQSSEKTYFVGSMELITPLVTGHVNRMVMGSAHSGLLEAQDKFRLVPGGEDLPYVMRFALEVTNNKSMISYFDYARSVRKGGAPLTPFQAGLSMKIAAGICSSIISPQDYRDFVRNGATLLSNSASLATFNGSPLFDWQQQTMAKFMAVANNRYFLQSANGATAYAIDRDGNKYASISGISTRKIVARTDERLTLYALYGEWPVFSGAIVLFTAAVIYIRRRLRYK